MAHEAHVVIGWVFIGLAFCGNIYLAIAIGRIRAFGESRSRELSRANASAPMPTVTIFKPLAGLETELYENLESFVVQDYPVYQVVFGVRHPDDPALAVVRRLIAAHPERDLELVVDERVRGLNLKVANVLNMQERAKSYDIFVVADSDMRVDPGYLRAVVAPFADPHTGAVTCLYAGEPRGGVASALGAMFMNDIFGPSVLVSLLFQKLRFCLGGTMAVRREVLQAIGGFEILATHLADDELLGRLVSDRGLNVVLSKYVVRALVVEATLRHLWSHEVRWARTIFHARPAGYAFFFITYALPLSVIALAISLDLGWGVGLVALALVLRAVLHYTAHRALDARVRTAPWLIPVRDFLALAEWAVSLFGRTVRWKGHEFRIAGRGGAL